MAFKAFLATAAADRCFCSATVLLAVDLSNARSPFADKYLVAFSIGNSSLRHRLHRLAAVFDVLLPPHHVHGRCLDWGFTTRLRDACVTRGPSLAGLPVCRRTRLNVHSFKSDWLESVRPGIVSWNVRRFGTDAGPGQPDCHAYRVVGLVFKRSRGATSVLITSVTECGLRHACDPSAATHQPPFFVRGGGPGHARQLQELRAPASPAVSS